MVEIKKIINKNDFDVLIHSNQEEETRANWPVKCSVQETWRDDKHNL